MAPPAQGRRKQKRSVVKTHHGYFVAIFIAGCLLPPIAVLLRFGVGKDFFLNILFTLMGYFPGHGHNFYLQNIRNNEGRNRTPKWALKYGLIADDSKKLKTKREWANRYDQNHSSNPYDDPSLQAEDEWGNRIADPTNAFNTIPAIIDDARADHEHGRLREDGDLPASARQLERYDSHDSDNASFYGDADARHGAAPGTDEGRNRKSAAPLRAMMTGTKSKSAAKGDRFATMEQERNRSNQAYDNQRNVGDDLDHTF